MDIDAIDAAFRQSPLIEELVEVFEAGDFSRFDADAKRQHFVPRFLLAHFAVRRDNDEVLYQLDTESGAVVRVKASEAASRRYFYAVLDEEGNRNNRIEGFLSRVEAHAAGALERLLADPKLLSDPDRATLAFFFALQDVRTNVAIERASAASRTIVPLLLAQEFSDTDAFTRSYTELFGETSSEDIEEFRQVMLNQLRDGSITLADPKVQALDAGFGAAAHLAYLIFAMDWRLLTCDGGFITSDRGLAMYDPSPPFPFAGQSWQSSPKAQTTIPLSASACLLIRTLSPGIDVQEIDEEGALELNLRTYGWADGYVFGRSEELVTSVHDLAMRSPEDVERPMPRSQVLLLEADPADTALAEANDGRGWPLYIVQDGVKHDYVVIPHGENPLEIAAQIDKKVEERARRKLGIPEGQVLEGRPMMDLIDPTTLS